MNVCQIMEDARQMQIVQIQLEVSIVNVILVIMEMGFLVLVLYFLFFSEFLKTLSNIISPYFPF